MPIETPTQYRDRLLIEHIASAVGFDSLAERLPVSDLYPPYLFVVVGLFVEYGIFDLYNYFVTGKSSFVTQPNSLAIPALTLLGVVGARYMHDAYAEAIPRLGIADADTDVDDTQFEGLVPTPVRFGAYVVVLAIYYAFAALVLGFGQLVSISGVGLVVYAQLVSFPLIVVPVMVELGLTYVAVHFAVPRRLAAADLGLFFYDPRNLGGFEPIGQLLKRSYYIYTGALLLWFLQTHLPVILSQFITSPYPAPGPIVQLAISAAWLGGIATIGYSMYRIHGLMKAEKDERIRTLEDELKDAVDNPYDAHPSNVTDREQYENAIESLEHVRNTKTYPTTFAMWSQILVSVLLPQALNMVVQLPQ